MHRAAGDDEGRDDDRAQAVGRWDGEGGAALLREALSDGSLLGAAGLHLLGGRVGAAAACLDLRAGRGPGPVRPDEAAAVALAERIRSWRGEARDPALVVPGPGAPSWSQDVVLLATSVAGTIDLLGRSRYREALHHASVQSVAVAPALRSHLLPGLAEAAARLGHGDLAVHACGRLEAVAEEVGGPWALGVLARTRAVARPDHRADDQHRTALALLATAGMPLDLAWAHLLYGEWLRRERRSLDARGHLRHAAAGFHALGIVAFDLRVAAELAATGEGRARPVVHGAELTPQERAVAERARDGLTNREIATEMFISAATVTYHLQKVFSKLGISSRRHLGRVLTGDASGGLVSAAS